MTKIRTVKATGLNETLNQLLELGKAGDDLVRQAANSAAALIRSDYIVRQLSADTGVSQRVLLASSRIQKANKKYPYSRINFSSGGIPVGEYEYRARRVAETRAQIILSWVGGGEKLAAGFINPKGGKGAALSTRNDRAAGASKKAGKRRYSYNQGKLMMARAPSMATMFLAMNQGAVDTRAGQQLAAEVVSLLDNHFGK